MRRLLFVLIACLGLVPALSGCGGGGGGDDPLPGISDRDGDGVPDSEDAFPDDRNRFAAFGTPVELQPFAGGNFSLAVSVNNNDEVVGQADGATGRKAALWAPAAGNAYSAPEVLAALPEAPPDALTAAYAINDQRQAAGEAEGATPNQFTAVVWNPGAAAPVALPGAAAGLSSAAYSINNNGFVAGEVEKETGLSVGALWTVTTGGQVNGPTELPGLSGNVGAAYFVDNNGRLVGEATDATGRSHAMLWTVREGGAVTAEDLSKRSLEGTISTVAFGINAEGNVVGETEFADGTVRATLWKVDSGGSVTEVLDMGRAGVDSTLLAINKDNKMVGWKRTGTAVTSVAEASAWDIRFRDRTQADPVLSAGFSQGMDLNDSGRVVGLLQGTLGDRGFVVTPLVP
jgi:hypothetical protein